MIQIMEINTKDKFYKMRENWNSILNDSLENHIYLTWEKMVPSVNQLENTNSLKILCATEDDRLIGIAPFRKTRRRLKGNFTYNIIEPLTSGNTDYTGLILANKETQCLTKFLEYLFKQKDWDLFCFPDLPQSSITLEIMKKIKDLPRLGIEKGWMCPYIPIPKSKEILLANLNSKFRKELRRRLSKLEREKGKVELKNYYELGPLNEGLNLLFKLHQKRWKLKGQLGGFSKKKTRDIAIQTANFFAEHNWLRLYFLTVNNKPVAAELDWEYNGKMYSQLCGFDPDYSKYSVGSLLILKVLEKCVDKGLSEYDFLQGYESYKFYWTNKYRQNMNVQFTNKKLNSKLISLELKVLNFLKIYIRKLISKNNLINRCFLILLKIAQSRKTVK